MTRIQKVTIGVVVLAIFALVLSPTTRASDEPQVVRVTLNDYQVELSQFTVMPGKAVQFVIANKGALAHQFVVEPFLSTAGHAEDEPFLAPGTISTIQRTLSSGVYRVECASWDHASRGIVNVLVAQAESPKSIPIQVDFVIPMFLFIVGSIYIIGDSLGLRLTRSA